MALSCDNAGMLTASVDSSRFVNVKQKGKEVAKQDKKPPIRLTPEQWEEIKCLYRANQLSLVQIAKKFGVTSAAISVTAKRKGWKRNLGNQVREEIKKRVQGELVGVDEDSQEFQDRCIVEEAADFGLRIVREHQGIISEYLDVVKEFVLTLRSTKNNADPKDFSIALNNAVNALEKLVKMDRQAANLNQNPEDNNEATDKVDQLLNHIHENGSTDEEVY